MNVNDWFETLQHDYIEQEGARLLSLEQEWRAKVPPQIDRAVENTIDSARARVVAGLPLLLGPALIRPKKSLAPVALRTAAVGLAAATAIAVGSYTLSPEVRDQVGKLFSAEQTSAVEQSWTEPRGASDYVIPSPGEEFAVVDDVSGNQVRYLWFRDGNREVLVEVLFYEPKDTTGGRPEPIAVGGLSGTYSELNGKSSVILEDDGTWLAVQCSNLDRAEVLAYAETLVKANR